jgi:hypothetical protein
MPSQSKACPLCRKPASSQFSPFCSPGCKNRDLLKWLGDGYSIPGPSVDPDRAGVDSESDEG